MEKASPSTFLLLAAVFFLDFYIGESSKSIRIVPESSVNWTLSDACSANTTELVGTLRAYLVDGDTQSIANSNRLNPAFRDLVLLNSTSDFTLSFANKRKASTNIRVERASTSNPLALGTYLFRVVYMFQESSDQDEPLDVTLVYNQSISVVPEYHIVVNGAPADAESFPLSYGQKLSLMLNVISRSKYSIINTKYTLISENSDFPEYFTLSVDSDGNSVLVWQENAPPPVSDYKLVVSANVTASVDDGELCSHTVQATVTVNVFPRISSIEGNLLNNTAVRISWNVNGSGNGSVNYTITIQEPKNTIRLYTTNMYMVVSPLPHIPSTVEVGVITDTAAGTTTGSEQFILDTTALRPDPPFNVKAVINPNDVTLTVSWEPSSYAGSINYTVIVRTVATGLLQFQAGSVTMFVIEDIGLKAMTIKSISVKAKNIIGISEESTGVTPTTINTTPTEPVVLSMTVIIVISSVGGFLALVLVFLLLCVSVLCCKLGCRSKHKTYKMQSRNQMLFQESTTLNRLYHVVEVDDKRSATIGYSNSKDSLTISNKTAAQDRPLPQLPEEPLYYEIPIEHLDQYQLGLRAKRLASTSHNFKPLWHPYTGKLDIEGIGTAKIGGGSALKRLGHREAIPEDYQKKEVYNTFEKVYHADATGQSLLTCFELKSEQITMLEQIGHGEFGRVYKACGHGILPGEKDTLVAVKILKEDTCEQARKDFLSEAQLLAHFGHPYVLSLLGVCTQGIPLMVVTPYFANGCLKAYLKRTKDTRVDSNIFKESSRMFLMSEQIASGMEYLASRFFIHRDLAARNILVGDNLTCVISDFGMCRVLARDRSFYEIKEGNRLPLKWMAPESLQYWKFSTYSDVWSFGVVMWEIATWGETPLKGVPPTDVVSYLASGKRMEKPDNCPDKLYNMMCECWLEEPAKRPLFRDLRRKLNQTRKLFNIHSITSDEENNYI